MDLKCTKIDSQEPKESNDVRFVALGCIVFVLFLACENSAENFRKFNSKEPYVLIAYFLLYIIMSNR